MSQFSKIFKNLKEKLFGKSQIKPDTESTAPYTTRKTTPQSSKVVVPVAKRAGYFIQIGFDFGTSYSKCVCRDIMINKPWVYIPSISRDQELPFLIPSALVFENNQISHLKDTEIHYPENGLYHIKNALVLVVKGELGDSSLIPYRKVAQLKNCDLSHLIEACAVYFLAGAFGEIRKMVRAQFSGFGSHDQDFMAINLAVPVESAQQTKLAELYQGILSEAWDLADQLAGHRPITLEELGLLRKKNRENKNQATDEACFIYPEVSAGVQGFVRSQNSSPGIYLFSDTGGSTVDQSIFIFNRQDHQEYLTYLAARVLPFGSSQIERRIAKQCGKSDYLSLEIWRNRKERGENSAELQESRKWIGEKLYRGTEGTIARGKKKLFSKDQLNDMRVIFGGGGHCERPYKTAVIDPFSGQLFGKAHQPDIIGFPVPRDIELKKHEEYWMKRLNVAYGLSFIKDELVPFTYPSDLSDPRPEDIWQPRKLRGDAPTKDHC